MTQFPASLTGDRYEARGASDSRLGKPAVIVDRRCLASLCRRYSMVAEQIESHRPW